MSLPLPEKTPEIAHEERKSAWFQRIMLVAVASLLIASVLNLVQRSQDSAKQSTTALAAKRSLQVAERQDCRSEYSSQRTSVLEAADHAARDSLAATMDYLLSRGQTGDIQKASNALTAAEARVGKLKSLPEMVDNGWTGADGIKHPPCPVVR